MPMVQGIRSNYRILVSRCATRPQATNLRPEAELYPFNVTEPIPQFLFPLLLPDEEPVVNLAEILTQVYHEAALDLAMAYAPAYAYDYSVDPLENVVNI